LGFAVLAMAVSFPPAVAPAFFETPDVVVSDMVELLATVDTVLEGNGTAIA
jgi:hypothetical protein